MSATAANLELVAGPEARVRLVRGFELPLEDAWDGRTLDTRVVPYNTAVLVADPPDFHPYREMFMPGVFRDQLSTSGRDRVLLNFEHEQGIGGVIGQSLRFDDLDDGLHASFGILETGDGDKALQMIRSGFLRGLSIEFKLPKAGGSKRIDGVVQRVKANLEKVSLCRYPAYQAAEVLALREELEADQPPPPPPSPAPPPPRDLARSTAIDELLASVGVEPLHRASKTSAPWDGSPARFTDEEYQRSTLFCRPGDAPPKQRCSLPVLEPGGTLNVNALGAAAAALSGARGGLRGVSPALKSAAARKLVRYYKQAGMEPPASLRALASAA